jgi:1,2-diacylglycerol 3-beta-glucosyltransferase
VNRIEKNKHKASLFHRLKLQLSDTIKLMSEGRSMLESHQVTIFIWAQILFLLLQIYIAFPIGYLILLTITSRKAQRSTSTNLAGKDWHFLVLIPAHNEERLLPELLESLAHQDYPASLVKVYVVADNCTDSTEDVARKLSAQVHVRNDNLRLGKGNALNWLLARLWQSRESFDAIVYLDADSVISPSFLQVMASHLSQGEQAIQAFYSVRDPGKSWTGSLRYAALAVLHYLRPQGRMVLGASVGLKGNGMVFTADLMRQHSWSESLTEDIEMHMALLLSGERVTFAPDAIVWGEMPSTLANSDSQHSRWERGRKQISHTYNLKLLRQIWKELRGGHFLSAYQLFDAIMENIIPPFSILVGASVISIGISLLFYVSEYLVFPQQPFWNGTERNLAAVSLVLAIALLFGQLVYLFEGLRLVEAPAQVYLNLVHAPHLIVWKIWHSIRMITTHQENTWIRTKRNQG